MEAIKKKQNGNSRIKNYNYWNIKIIQRAYEQIRDDKLWVISLTIEQ